MQTVNKYQNKLWNNFACFSRFLMHFVSGNTVNIPHFEYTYVHVYVKHADFVIIDIDSICLPLMHFDFFRTQLKCSNINYGLFSLSRVSDTDIVFFYAPSFLTIWFFSIYLRYIYVQLICIVAYFCPLHARKIMSTCNIIMLTCNITQVVIIKFYAACWYK